MAQYVTEGTASIHHVDFIVNGQLVVPSVASYHLMDNSGATIGGSPANRPISISSGQTGADLAISGSDNTATLPNEIRYVETTFTHDGKSYKITEFYLLKAVVRLPLTGADVRAVLGVTEAELPDQNIDLQEALFLAQEDIPDVDILAAITSGGDTFTNAVLCIKLKAALTAITTIENFMLQSEQADTSIYKRFMTIDFKAQREGLQTRYNSAINVVNGIATPADPTISIMAVGTDNVTGA